MPINQEVSRKENRPYAGRPTWELKNIKKALSFHPWLNTDEEMKRLENIHAELQHRKEA